MKRAQRDALDSRMIDLARRHGTVLVRVGTEREVQATLLGWRAGAGRRWARVQYLNGHTATACGSNVRPVPEGPR